MHKRFVTTSGKRSLKKLPKDVRDIVFKATELLETDPYAGEKLSGPLYFLYSFHFKIGNVEYRAAYTIDIVTTFLTSKINKYL